MSNISDQKLKIATWNVERPSNSSKIKNGKILEALKGIDADILILTETNSCINPGEGYCSFATSSLTGSFSTKDGEYREGENRVTIWSKFPGSRHKDFSDSHSSICAAISTPLGELNVYGTIIGIYGNRDKSFNVDLEVQLADWQRLCRMGNVCIAGDFNISFADGYYYTKLGRQKMDDCFQSLKVDVPTRKIPQNIDHIAISESLLKSVVCKTEIWNEDKKLSDHMGVWLTLERS